MILVFKSSIKASKAYTFIREKNKNEEVSFNGFEISIGNIKNIRLIDCSRETNEEKLNCAIITFNGMAQNLILKEDKEKKIIKGILKNRYILQEDNIPISILKEKKMVVLLGLDLKSSEHKLFVYRDIQNQEAIYPKKVIELASSNMGYKTNTIIENEESDYLVYFKGFLAKNPEPQFEAFKFEKYGLEILTEEKLPLTDIKLSFDDDVTLIPLSEYYTYEEETPEEEAERKIKEDNLNKLKEENERKRIEELERRNQEEQQRKKVEIDKKKVTEEGINDRETIEGKDSEDVDDELGEEISTKVWLIIIALFFVILAVVVIFGYRIIRRQNLELKAEAETESELGEFGVNR